MLLKLFHLLASKAIASEIPTKSLSGDDVFTLAFDCSSDGNIDMVIYSIIDNNNSVHYIAMLHFRERTKAGAGNESGCNAMLMHYAKTA